MIWLAYSGFTGSVVLSIVFLTWMLGMPVLPALSLAIQTGVILFAAAAVTTLVFNELRKRSSAQEVASPRKGGRGGDP